MNVLADHIKATQSHDDAASLIEAVGVRKRYGEGASAVDALVGVDLTVRSGEIVGILGPNGAGKTTFVEILEGIRSPDAGYVRVLGETPTDEARFQACRGRLGISLQNSVLPPLLTVAELLSLQKRLFASTIGVDDLVIRVGLGDKRDSRIHQLSGGQQQRVAVAMALVGNPSLMFLDEPTSQLDPQARRLIWEELEKQRRHNRTSVLITTHQMEEAQRLCDRVVILDHGRVIAAGTPDGLVDEHCPERRVSFVVPDTAKLDFIDEPVMRSLVGEGQMQIQVQTKDASRFLSRFVEHRQGDDGEIRQLRVEQPSLEDVFIKLTGSQLR